MIISQTKIETPLGLMIACATTKGICLLDFTDRKNFKNQILKISKELNAKIIEEENPHFSLLRKELNEYFDRRLKEFTVPLHIIGTDFQKEVWQALLSIPYGSTSTYLKQSNFMEKPLAIRAVANANGMNKIAIIIPCHRVIGSNGKLIGYAGGLERKSFLLKLEKGITQKDIFE